MPAANAADGHPIKWTRPEQKDNHYHVIVTAKRHESVRTFSGPKENSLEVKDLQVTLNALVTVARVNEAGRPTELHYQVAGLRTTENREGSKPLLGKGHLIVARLADNKTVCTLNGQTPAEPVLTAVILAVGEMADDLGQDDLMLGSTEPRVQKETWAADAKALSEYFRGKGLAIRPDAVSGKITCKAVLKSKGVETIGAEFLVGAAVDRAMTPGIEPTQIQLLLRGRAMLPLDLTLRPQIKVISTRLAVFGTKKAEDGMEQRVEHVTEISIERIFSDG